MNYSTAQFANSTVYYFQQAFHAPRYLSLRFGICWHCVHL